MQFYSIFENNWFISQEFPLQSSPIKIIKSISLNISF
jgi:hypothetical protein